jgi:hypothetical protein
MTKKKNARKFYKTTITITTITEDEPFDAEVFEDAVSSTCSMFQVNEEEIAEANLDDELLEFDDCFVEYLKR